jgi:hypothetical protein
LAQNAARAAHFKERPMRKNSELEQLLENAVAAALGVDIPHPKMPSRLRVSRRRPVKRMHRSTAAGHRERTSVAA